MTEFQTLSISRRDAGVAQVTMSRPGVCNAFDETMIAEIDSAFARLAGDATVRVIVLAGNGRHFSAGADLHWMQRASAASLQWNLDDARRFAAMLARLENCPKPTVRAYRAQRSAGVSASRVPATSPSPLMMSRSRSAKPGLASCRR